MTFVPVILAGGSGERFWPLSRRAKPKQFLTLDGGDRSLLQATVDRLEPLVSDGIDSIHIVTGQMHRALILEQLPNLPLENMIVEPEAKDTAAAVLLATLRIAKTHGEEAIIGIFPSDHRIGNAIAFQDSVNHAIRTAASSNAIVTLGMTPQYAAIGYGYIESGAPHSEGVQHVKRFVEKPNLETAEKYLERGGYHWNAGMFIFRASVMIELFKQLAPELYNQLEAADTRTALKAAFETIRKVSIDYAILEPASIEGRVVVIPAEFSWDDLGDWNALARVLQGTNPNLEIGQHIGLDTSGAIMYTTTGNDLIVTLGLEDVVIVRDGNSTLIARKDRTQDIRKLVERMKTHPELSKYV